MTFLFPPHLQQLIYTSIRLLQNSNMRFSFCGLQAELATPAPEHPSPVSILDASIYRDDETSPSPVKQIAKALKGDQICPLKQKTFSDSIGIFHNLIIVVQLSLFFINLIDSYTV